MGGITPNAKSALPKQGKGKIPAAKTDQRGQARRSQNLGVMGKREGSGHLFITSLGGVMWMAGNAIPKEIDSKAQNTRG